MDARYVSLLIANFSGDALARLSHVSGYGLEQDGRNERVESIPLSGTAHERVLFSQTREVVRHAEDWRVLVPITERGDAIGILEVAFARKPDTSTVYDLAVATHAWAYALIASRRHTDLFEWAQRDIPFSIAAELQRRLLPAAYTAEAGPLTLAGWLEPSHDVGGDTFDYCLDREYVYLDHRRHGSRHRRRAAGHLDRRHAAQPSTGRSVPSRTGRRRERSPTGQTPPRTSSSPG